MTSEKQPADASVIPLAEDALRSWLVAEYRNIPITVLESVDSTNTYLKTKAAEDAAAHTLVLAEGQTAGRGRRGRNFYSPGGTGLYMSMLLRPQQPLADVQMTTIAAAVAVARALECVAPWAEPQIKWVNDIFSHGRKVCGILAEAADISTDGRVGVMVVGVGVNVSTADFPEELRATATSLKGTAAIDRNRLAAEIVNEFLALADNITDAARREILRDYRARSLAVGRQITYEEKGQKIAATVMEINDKGNLVVSRAEDKTIATLSSGEISIKL